MQKSSYGFTQALESALLKNFFKCSGRARRSEYWYFMLFILIIFTILFFLIMLTKDILILILLRFSYFDKFGVLFCFLVGVPSVTVTIRRLHDIGKSGLYFFLIFIPVIGNIILLVFLLTDSQPEENIYGPCPKYENQNNNDFPQVNNNIDNQVYVSPPLINYSNPNQENIIHSQGIFVYQNNCNNSEISDVYPGESIN